MARKLYLKAKGLNDSEVNALEVYLYHSKERKCVVALAQGVELRRENGMTITTSMLYGGARIKLMDMPRFSQSKFDAIDFEGSEIKELINQACIIDKLALELNEGGGWVKI